MNNFAWGSSVFISFNRTFRCFCQFWILIKLSSSLFLSQMSNSSENIYFLCPGDARALWQQASNSSHHLFQRLNNLHVTRTGNPCFRFQLPLFLAVRSVYSDFYVWPYEGKVVFCSKLLSFSTLMQILEFETFWSSFFLNKLSAPNFISFKSIIFFCDRKKQSTTTQVIK